MENNQVQFVLVNNKIKIVFYSFYYVFQAEFFLKIKFVIFFILFSSVESFNISTNLLNLQLSDKLTFESKSKSSIFFNP